MRTLRIGPDDPRHGTYNGYNNYGCRCDPCRKAGSEYQEKLRRARGQKPWSEAFTHLQAHGWSRYKNGGCRCDVCRAAAAAQKRRQHAHNIEHYREYWRERNRARRAAS